MNKNLVILNTGLIKINGSEVWLNNRLVVLNRELKKNNDSEH